MLIVSLFGLIIGSFINAVVWRIHVKRSIGNDRSVCPNCKHVLAPLDLIPVVSWLLLGGRCRYCRKPISWQYPLVEILTAGLFGLSYLRLNPVGLAGWTEFLLWLYILGSLIVLAVYDLRWMLLPNVVIFPAMGAATLSLLIQLIASHNWSEVAGPLIAAAAAGAVFAVLALVADGKLMGFGDVKLVILMGLVLGLRKLGVALFVGFDSAAIIGIGLIILKLKKRSDHIPFGPFLVLGTVISYLYGINLIAWYLHLMI